MPGCNSECSFSLERNDIIKCLDGCKPGYIESSEGICENCYNINNGCNKCHYDENPTSYLGIKRKRKFICDQCDSNYYVKKDDKCINCYYIEDGCKECIMENNEFKCKQCYSNYIPDEKGHCNYCGYNSFIFEKKCIKCNDVNQGGIEGCNHCNIYGNKPSCSSCDEGYILLINNGTCLKISENNELKKYYICSEITIENNNFHCLECRDYRFSILKGENESICIYLPELNGYIDDYDYEDFYHYNSTPDINSIYKYYYNNYIINSYFSHCEEVINLGTKDNPLYSCAKCYYSYYLYTEEKTNISYCIYYYNVDNYEDTQNCTEKKIKILDKRIKFTCISCQKDNILIYHKIDEVNYCKYYPPIVLTDVIDSIYNETEKVNNTNYEIESNYVDNDLNNTSYEIKTNDIINLNNTSYEIETNYVNNASYEIETNYVNNLNNASNIISTENIKSENISSETSYILDSEIFESNKNSDLNETTESIIENKIKICMAKKVKSAKKMMIIFAIFVN